MIIASQQPACGRGLMHIQHTFSVMIFACASGDVLTADVDRNPTVFLKLLSRMSWEFLTVFAITAAVAVASARQRKNSVSKWERIFLRLRVQMTIKRSPHTRYVRTRHSQSTTMVVSGDTAIPPWFVGLRGEYIACFCLFFRRRRRKGTSGAREGYMSEKMSESAGDTLGYSTVVRSLSVIRLLTLPPNTGRRQEVCSTMQMDNIPKRLGGAKQTNEDANTKNRPESAS